METLQDLLRARLGADPRAHIAAIDEQHGQLRLIFGGIGALPRVVIGIVGNHIRLIEPEIAGGEPVLEGDPKKFPEKIVFDDYSKEELVGIAKMRKVQIKPNETKGEIAAVLNRAAGYED